VTTTTLFIRTAYVVTSWGRAVTARVALIVLALVVVTTWSRALHAEPGDELTISVLTFGPGDHPFTKFGHDGVLVEDAAAGTSLVFNYGTFSFRSVWLIPKFLVGKYHYWLSVSPFSSVVTGYAAENRSVVQQRLVLSAAQKRTIYAFLNWNALEENRYYLYDYYRDNCATKIRDVIDGATDGALHHATRGAATFTWREHTERLAGDDWLVYLGLDLAMGSFIDQPISFWQEMFLPAQLQEGLRRTVVSAIDANGAPTMRNLVSAEMTIVADHRPPPRTAPPERTTPLLAAGGVAALVLAALGFATRRGLRAARALLGTSVAVLGVVLGGLGCLFLFLWTATNHEVAYHNENLLQCVPFALVLAWQGAVLALGRKGSATRAHRTALIALGCSAAGLLLKALPWFDQHNGHLIAFFLPLWAGVAVATRLAAQRA
jgi:hypothetical protein